MRTVYYFVPATIVSVFIILHNFQSLSKMMHKKPIWFEDLRDDRALEVSVKFHFQKIFITYINISLALVSGILVEYMVYRLNESTFSYIEFSGLLGGVLSLYSKFQDHAGNILLGILIHRKQQIQDI
jgi:hypothetical protein